MLLLAVMCVACNPDSGKKKISIAYANWLEGIAMSHLAKVVLEEKGYEVELLNADVAPVFASVSRKKADVFMDAWLPVTMKDYIDQYGDQIEFIGEVYDSARVGLVVPQYVTIDSIGELAAHKGQFSSEIVGIDAGAGIMKTTDKAIGDYGLDGYKLLTSSKLYYVGFFTEGYGEGGVDRDHRMDSALDVRPLSIEVPARSERYLWECGIYLCRRMERIYGERSFCGKVFQQY